MRQEANVDSWLMSYADMITLLLCFFVIFVAISEPKKERVAQITEGMREKFGMVENTTPFAGSMRSLQSSINRYQLYRDVAFERTTTSLTLELSTQKFFRDGSVEIDTEMTKQLNELIAALKETDLAGRSVSIESHTDDSPPNSGLYKNNWEFSAVRAAKLAHYFVQQGFPASSIKAVGYGDARPKVPNSDAKGKPIEANRERNQRITITLE